LALDWLLAVSAGGVAMGGVRVHAGDCLYLALEDGPRRLQSRIIQLQRGQPQQRGLDRLTIWTSAPRLDEGLLQRLEEWVHHSRSPRLIVVDVFAKIRPSSRVSDNAYDADYRALGPLQEWVTRTGIAVLLLHHTRKAAADDPLETLSGSNGLPGAADTILVLDRDANGTTLYVRGRDIEERETALRFEEGQWIIAGDAADVRVSRQRAAILAAIDDVAEPLGPSQIAALTGMKAANVRALLHKLGNAGEVQRTDYGKYVRPEPTVRADNTGNTDNS
jgi:hypothetical protein